MATQIEFSDRVLVLDRAAKFSRSLQAHPNDRALVSALVAYSYVDLPNKAKSAQIVRECLTETPNILDVNLRASVLENVTKTVKRMDDRAIAIPLLEEILEQTARFNRPALEQPLRQQISDAFSKLGDRDRAAAILRES